MMATTMRRRKSVDVEDPPGLIPVTSLAIDDDEGDSQRSNAAVAADVDDEMSASNRSRPRWRDAELDKFLAQYTSLFYGTYVADLGMKLLQWTSWAVSYFLRGSRFSALSPGLYQLYYEVSMARYVLRFHGFLQSLEGYRSGSWAGTGWSDPLIDKVAKYAMAGSMLFYYPLEHVAYAGWRLPELVIVNPHLFSVVSCGFWFLYVIGDVAICILKLKELKRKLGALAVKQCQMVYQ